MRKSADIETIKTSYTKKTTCQAKAIYKLSQKYYNKNSKWQGRGACKVYALRDAIEDAMRGENEIQLTIGNAEHFVPKNEILFFESGDGKVYAHTRDAIYTAPYKLFELESLMPPFFVRISKSAIANLHQITSIRREVVGNGELTFRGSQKKIYFSRAYYKLLQYKMEEMRLGK